MTDHFARPDTAFLDRIKALLGAAGWRAGADAARYLADPRGRFAGRASLVVLPGSTDQVAAIVRLCNEAKVGLIPYGGGTGVVAGQLSTDSDHAIILSLERMNRVREVLPEDGVMIAEAGCILETIHDRAGQYGMMFPLSMASKGSCTIGGNLATNAGGIQVLRYGNARDLCLGIEAVLPCGTVLSELSPLRKNNTGYDLRHLLVGSEGTLGVITAAALVLAPIDPETVTVLCALDAPAQALRLHDRIRKDLGGGISGIELMSGFGLDLLKRHFPALTPPFNDRHDWYVLVEATGPVGTRARVEDALAAAMEQEILLDAVFAGSQAQRQSLWALRENMPEANRKTGAICNSDTAVPVSRVDRFIALTADAVATIHAGLRINSYGHVGDGNIHHNVFPPAGVAKADFTAAHPGVIDAVRMAINDATHACGGSISAEHGIGRLKTRDLEHYASQARLDTLRRIKRALDPNNIMNPGALLG